MQKIVFNAHYLMYLDTAMADYWRALALPYESALQQLEGDLYVKKAALEYHGSAHYDEVLDIGLRCQRIGNSSILFEGGIFCGDSLLVSGDLVYVFANPHTQVPKPVPTSLRAVFEAYEAGQPVVNLQIGDWRAVGVQASALREEVFVKEQGIGAQMVWDASDADAVHALACNHLGQVVASGRLLQSDDGVGRIGRVAVSRVLRGSGLGREVLQALARLSQSRGDTELVLSAQCSAEGFYHSLGFSSRGTVFEEASVRHIEMVMKFPSEAQ